MYFSSLEALKGSELPDSQLDLLDESLAELCQQRNRVFGVTLFARSADIDFDTAVALIIAAASVHVVGLQYELVCPECGTTEAVLESPTQVQSVARDCRQCFETFVPTQEDVWVTFRITAEPSGEVELKKKP